MQMFRILLTRPLAIKSPGSRTPFPQRLPSVVTILLCLSPNGTIRLGEKLFESRLGVMVEPL